LESAEDGDSDLSLCYLKMWKRWKERWKM